MSKQTQQIVVVESKAVARQNNILNDGLAINRQQLQSLMENAGIPQNLSNKDAIKMVCKAIRDGVACKTPDQLTLADAFALRAADIADNAPTAGEEVAALLRNAGF